MPTSGRPSASMVISSRPSQIGGRTIPANRPAARARTASAWMKLAPSGFCGPCHSSAPSGRYARPAARGTAPRTRRAPARRRGSSSSIAFHRLHLRRPKRRRHSLSTRIEPNAGIRQCSWPRLHANRAWMAESEARHTCLQDELFSVSHCPRSSRSVERSLPDIALHADSHDNPVSYWAEPRSTQPP